MDGKMVVEDNGAYVGGRFAFHIEVMTGVELFVNQTAGCWSVLAGGQYKQLSWKEENLTCHASTHRIISWLFNSTVAFEMNSENCKEDATTTKGEQFL